MLHLRCVENTYVLPKGIVWFLCQDGRLFRLDMQKFRDGGEGIAEHPMKGKRIYRIHQDADGNEWLLTNQGIEIVGNRSINAPDLIFRHIKERNGYTYLVSEGGELFVFRQQKGDFERLATPGSSEPVTSLKNLGRDTLLLQTPHSLTFYACKSGTASTFHTADVGRAESTINQVHTDKKGICWILLNPHEMLRLNPQTGDSRLYALPPSTFRNRARQSRSLVFNDPHGMLWVIPEHEALCYYDAGTDCFRTYLRNPEDPSSSYVPFIRYSLLDRQGNLWYAPYTGLEKVSFLPHFFTLHTLEKEMDIRSFLNDRQGNLWVGSQNGTLRIYQHGDKRPLYVTPQGKLTTQPSAFPGGAYALLQARNGDIWLGTKEAGLYRLRPSGARHFTVSHYTPEPGNPYSLSANSVYALCEDSRGRIWVGTFGGGLNLVQEHADGQVQFIHRGNVLKGFPLKDARIRCLKESPDSILLVGTTDGLIACRTSFRHPEDIIFRHHRHIGGDRTSLNSNGVWMDNTRSLRLVVEPKFTETAWAWALYVLLFLLLVGTVGYVLFYIYRLRHRIDMEQQLADIKLRFFTDISHELRTPLTLIAGPVEEVLQSRELSDKDREHLSLVRTNTRRMLRMMNQILDFRKLQNRKMKLIVEEADLIALLRQVMLHFRAMAEAKHIAFTLSSPVDSLTMWLDTDKVEKVFFNLLSNAFKYTPDGKSVSIEVSLSDRTVSIAVADRGIGIDEQHRKMLFHRFENFTHSDMMHPSSGIGLSMAREMVGLHHGQIDVESQVGEGSRFTVTLPLSRSAYEHDEHTEFILNDGTASASPQDSDRGNREAEDNGDDERLTLLVVEDNDELRLFLRNILSADYRVIEATDGKQGLELACEHIPDLLITDVMMPVMDGLEMVSRIKADRTVCHIPIIILSAKSSLDDRIVGLERGIDDYITKPFSATYLKTRIRTLIRRRQELQEFYRARFQPHPEETAAPADAESAPTAYEPKRPQLESLDDRFMEQVMECIEQNMDNQDFEIETLAEHLFMSRTVFYRKLKSITGMTPVAFVGEMRIKRALQLMENDGLTISQVAYMTGFNSPKYFSKVFKKAVGCTPSEYKEQKKGDDE